MKLSDEFNLLADESPCFRDFFSLEYCLIFIITLKLPVIIFLYIGFLRKRAIKYLQDALSPKN